MKNLFFIQRIVSQLKCSHNYIFKESVMLYCGMQKMITHKCTKCAKEKIYYV